MAKTVVESSILLPSASCRTDLSPPRVAAALPREERCFCSGSAQALPREERCFCSGSAQCCFLLPQKLLTSRGSEPQVEVSIEVHSIRFVGARRQCGILRVFLLKHSPHRSYGESSWKMLPIRRLLSTVVARHTPQSFNMLFHK